MPTCVCLRTFRVQYHPVLYVHTIQYCAIQSCTYASCTCSLGNGFMLLDPKTPSYDLRTDQRISRETITTKLTGVGAAPGVPRTSMPPLIA